MKEIVTTSKAPAAVGPYSQAVKAGGFLFISGQIGLDPETGSIVKGGVEVEAARVLENIKAILEAAGAGVEHVVKTTVYLQSIDDFAAVNDVYRRVFAEDFPARVALEIGRLPLGALVEIEAIARLE